MDKRSNPRSRQFAFPPPPAKRARTVSEMSPLPAEIYLEILKHLPAQDLLPARLVSRKFNSLISNYGKNMDRTKFAVKLVGTKEGIVIEHNMKGRLNTQTESLDSFHFDKWTFVEVDSLELNSLKSSEETLNALELLLDALSYYKQFRVRSLSIQRIQLDKSFVPILQELFEKVVPTCQDLLFRDCILPAMISDIQISNSKFSHFRWIDSPLNPVNDYVVKKFTEEMKIAKEKKNFLAEVNCISVETACDFVETWLNSPVAAFFNLTLQGCDMAWKDKFMLECESRKLTHYCMEFQSKGHSNAHIKVNFLENAGICRIWPIFDTPARSAGRVHCYARYFRDF